MLNNFTARMSKKPSKKFVNIGCFLLFCSVSSRTCQTSFTVRISFAKTILSKLILDSLLVFLGDKKEISGHVNRKEDERGNHGLHGDTFFERSLPKCTVHLKNVTLRFLNSKFTRRQSSYDVQNV